MAVVNLSFDFPFTAFLTVLGGMGLMMGGIFTGFAMKYRCVFEVFMFVFGLLFYILSLMDTLLNFSMLPQLRKLKIDTSSAQSFKALKSFFTYVDDLEHIVNKKKLNEKEFREALDQLTGLHVSEEESDFIFRMLDANKDGLINTENELKFSKNDSNK